MKVSTIKSSWLAKGGFRLDCSPYLGGAIETEILLEELPVRKDSLGSVTSAIFNGPQFVRNYVDDPDCGVPFMTGSTMLLADLSDLPLLSKRDAHSSKLNYLQLQPSMTLISCSGSIGKMTYARQEMSGIWASQDILKVAADPEKILPGYLYAFLSSKFGVPLITSGTYGAIIQHLEPAHITGLSVPRFGDAIEKEIHELVEEAAQKRTIACWSLKKAIDMVQDHFGMLGFSKGCREKKDKLATSVMSSSLRADGRMDAHHYNSLACSVDKWMKTGRFQSKQLGEIAQVFDVPPFKHIYVESDEGVGFLTSAEIFKVDRTPTKFLSRVQTKGLQKYVLEDGWVLLARSGSLGGNIGKIAIADSSLAGQTASDHVIRISARTKECSDGYIFAFLSTPEIGYTSLLRTAAGSCIPALWPLYLEKMHIPLPSPDLNRETDRLVKLASEERVMATELESQARRLVEVNIEKH